MGPGQIFYQVQEPTFTKSRMDLYEVKDGSLPSIQGGSLPGPRRIFNKSRTDLIRSIGQIFNSFRTDLYKVQDRSLPGSEWIFSGPGQIFTRLRADLFQVQERSLPGSERIFTISRMDLYQLCGGSLPVSWRIFTSSRNGSLCQIQDRSLPAQEPVTRERCPPPSFCCLAR